MTVREYGLLLIFLCAAALSPGCRCTDRLHPVPKNPISDPKLLLDALVRPPSVRNLTAFPRVEYYSKRDVRKGTVAMVLEPPDRLRFEALSPSGNMLALLTSDGARITLYQRGAKRCYRGPACARNIARLLPIAIEPRQLVRLLMGRAPVIRHTDRRMRFDRRAGWYQLTLIDTAAGRHQEIWLAPGTLRPMRSKLYEGKTLRLQLDWRSYRNLAGHPFPHRIDAKMPRGKVDLSIKFRELTPNRSLKMRFFRFDCPAGVTETPMTCGAQ
ncbi:MAG: DUF4292 domain-containing protein [Myxococcales bacterium]|nr:DUF4292 domain-containing protein [Myxococcales bacterium]